MYEALRVNGLCICEHDFSSAIITLLKLPKPIFVSVDLYCTGVPTFVLEDQTVFLLGLCEFYMRRFPTHITYTSSSSHMLRATQLHKCIALQETHSCYSSKLRNKLMCIL